MGRPGDRTYPPKKYVDWEALLARIFVLPLRDQLRIHQELTKSLGGSLGRETERDRQVRLRYEALEAMRAAAKHLGLPETRAPTIPEYKEAAKQAGLPSHKTVYRAFEENWEIATRFYLGEDVPATAAQRAARRAILGRNRTDEKETALGGVRLFLEQDPPPASTTCDDYVEWAREHNECLSPGEFRVVEGADHIRSVMRTGWERCLAVARDEVTLEEARELALAEQLSEAGPLIGHHLASWYLSLSPHARHAKRAGYPQPVVCLAKTNWLWLLADIEAYKRGKRAFAHERGALQDGYIDSHGLGALLDLSSASIKTRLSQEEEKMKTWERVPKPTGRAGKGLYWERAYAQRWLDEHPYAVRGFKSLRKRRQSAVSKISGAAA